MLGLIGCSSSGKVAVLASIGPAPTDGRPTTRDGSLQVYSARQPARVEFTTQEWLWNNDFGRNDFLFSSAHTDYAVYDEQGVLRRRVQNARDANDSEPAIVSLPAGCYEIQAETLRNQSATGPKQGFQSIQNERRERGNPGRVPNERVRGERFL